MVLLLRDQQAKADREYAATGQKVEAPLSWIAINQLIGKEGNPQVTYKEFDARWKSQDPSDQELKDLVARFDGQGIVVKTQGMDSTPQQGEPSQKSSVVSAADNATKRAFA